MSDGLHDADEAASAPERLAREHDEQVRTVLARRIASMVPTLDGPTQAHLRRHVLAILFKLVEDECVRVRAAIADAVKDMPQAPRKLVLQLAYDVDISVCGPVIRLSPLLTDADLLELLRTAPCPEAATAVARRPALNETVSDAIAAAANTNAVRALLANQSASIREATLDSLIAQSVNHTDWHDHLVRRPVLSSRAARALSRMVTARLLRVMCERGDLEPALAEELRQRLAERLAEQPAPEPAPDMSAQEAMAAARQLQAQQSLAEGVLLEALQRAEVRYAAALLAVAARVPLAVVDRAAALRSAKGLVSLAWQAGFSMEVALPLQAQLARLPPAAILQPPPQGGFPLMVEEMRWQLAFLSRGT
jgi:uncharacterized protein (DUF2336 family)